MIYAACLNEQQNFDNNNGMLFEMQLLQENLDMTYYLTTKSILNESLEDVKARVSKIIDNIKSFILRILDTIKSKFKRIIDDIKTRTSDIRNKKSDETVTVTSVKLTVNLMTLTRFTEETLCYAVVTPDFIEVMTDEKLTPEECEQKFLKHNLGTDKFESVSDITNDDLFKIENTEVDKNVIEFLNSELESNVVKIFNELDKYKNITYKNLSRLHDIINMTKEEEDVSNKLYNLNQYTRVYNKICNLYMKTIDKYITGINRTLRMTEKISNNNY